MFRIELAITFIPVPLFWLGGFTIQRTSSSYLYVYKTLNKLKLIQKICNPFLIVKNK